MSRAGVGAQEQEMGEIFSFGMWLRQRRTALLLSRDDLARQVGCAEVTLRKIEADERRPSLAIAERLVDVLELRAEERTLFLQVARGLASADHLPPPIPRGAAPAPAVPPIMAPALPSGTVTFLFTDIAGSTQLWEQHPQAMAIALARHDAILRQAIQTHQGVVVKSTGDGTHAVFVRAPDGLTAALTAQRALQAEPWEMPAPLRVRMALHTGVTEERDGDYFGPPLNRVARLLAAGHGGQTLLSLATMELVREQMPADAALRDLGLHRLKDLSRPEQIFQLVAPDLPADFPPLRTLDARRSNLPAQPTTLIGREQDIVTVCDLLRRPGLRLVTLTGPGGTGKTRLGIQVAAELLDVFADGVFFVNLAPIRDPNLVASAVAQTLGLTEKGDQPLVEQLRDYLRDKRLLLLLDNFEQVVDAAPLVAELLAGCPQLNILVTSRVPLHLRGEQEFAVPPLALPSPTDPSTPLRAGDRRPTTDGRHDAVVRRRSSVVTQYAAIQLFIQRALDVQPNFAVTNENAPTVVEICARLEGLPLAIELAAARIKMFAPEALLARLSNRLTLLTGGARDLPARQQTLRSAITWSYDLLDLDAQTLFARLAVFGGGCTIEAAEAVCDELKIENEKMRNNAPGRTFFNSQFSILNLIEALVDNSLLKREEGAGSEPRFRMLETIREYALERLAGSGELETIERRHADYFLQLAEEAAPYLDRAEAIVWLDRLETEHNNLRAALAWSQGPTGDSERGLRLVAALTDFWRIRGYYGEGMRWCAAVLTQSQDATPTRLATLLGAGWLAVSLFDIPQAQMYGTEALALARHRDDRPAIASALRLLAMMAWEQADFTQALALHEESLAVSRALGDPAYIIPALMEVGRHTGGPAGLALLEEALAQARQLGNQSVIASVLMPFANHLRNQEHHAAHTRAQALLEEASTLFRVQGDRGQYIEALYQLGALARDQSDYARAMTLLEEGLALARDIGNKEHIAGVSHELGETMLMQGDSVRAEALEREALELWREVGRNTSALPALNLAYLALQHSNVAQASVLLIESFAIARAIPGWIPAWLAGFAGLAASQGQMERAARLFSAAEALHRGPLPTAHRHAIAPHLAAVRALLDAATFDAAWAAGAALTLEQAIYEALNR